MFFRRSTPGEKGSSPKTRRFLPAIERLEARENPSTLVTSGPFTNSSTLLNDPASFTEAAGAVFYSATDAVRGNELVKQVGSAITVYDIRTGATGSSPNQLLNAGGILYFVANTGSGNQLFSMASGTPTVVPGSPNNVGSIAAIGRNVFLITSDGSGLYRTLTDTTAGTLSVVPITAGSISPSGTLPLSNMTGLVAGNSSLWITRTVGSSASLYRLVMSTDDQANAQFTAVNTGLASASAVSDLTFAGPNVYFNATVAGQKKLQVYNGSTITSLLPTGITGVGPLRQVNNRVYFAATQSGTTRLWSADGTSASMVTLVTYTLDSALGLTNSAVVGNTLFYSGKTPQGIEPAYVTLNLSGTIQTQGYFNLATGSVGTSPATQVERDSNPTQFTVANQRVFFSASIPTGVTTFRTDLWTTDATDAGTFLVNPPSGIANTASPTSITGIGNNVYYGGNNGKGQQPFLAQMTNTYSAGIVSSTLVPTAGSLVGYNNKNYFISGSTLYQSDGSSGGTTAIASGISGSQLVVYNGYLYFFRANALWRTSGNLAGGTTAQVANSPTTLNAGLFQGIYANQLWFSNGSTLYAYNSALTGAAAFRTISTNFMLNAPGISNGGPAIAELNGTVFFAATDGVYSLSQLDPTPVQISTVTAAHSLRTTANGVAFLNGTSSFVLTNGTTTNTYTPAAGVSLIGATATDPQGGNSIAFVEQTAATGVNQIKLATGLTSTLPAPITGFTANSNTVGLQTSTGYASTVSGLYLSLSDATQGAEPWFINSAGKASIVSNMNPLTGTGSNPDQFKAGAGTVVYFSADNGTIGREVYRYDPNRVDAKTGLPLPPTLTTDVNPTGSSNPDSLTPSGNSLFWRAEATSGNQRLYAELADPLIPPIRAITRLQPTTEVVSTVAGTTQVTFQVLFNYAVDPSSVTKEDFVLTKASTLKVGTIDSVQLVAGTNKYNVVVSLVGTNPGYGEIRLDESATAVFLNGGQPVNLFGGFTSGEVYSVNPQSPVVNSLNRFNPSTAAPVSASALTYLITFSTGIDPNSLNADDFNLVQGSGSTLVNARITSVAQAQGSFSQFYVQVAVDGGQGTLRADVKNGASIVSLENQPYQQAGFTGQTYTIDLVRPTLAQVSRLNPTTPDTNQAQVTFRVVFSEAMVQSTINPANTFLAVVDQGLPSQSYASVQAATFVNATTYDVRVAGLPLTGTLSLGINPNNQAKDVAGNTAQPNDPLSPPVPNETYTLSRQGPTITNMTVISPQPVDPTTATVTFQVVFSKLLDHASVTPDDFAVGVASGFVTGVVSTTQVFDDLTDPNNPFSYVDVTVNQLGGNGGFRLDIPPTATILDTSGNAFSAPYTGTVTYNIVDNVRPYFVSFEKIKPLGVVAIDGTAIIRLNFSEGVQGLVKAYLPTSLTGSLAYTGMSVSPANASGSQWDVTFTGLTGSGSLTMQLINNANITDSAGNPLVGTPGSVVGTYTTPLTRQSLTPITFSLSTVGSTPIVEIREPGGQTRNLQPFDSAFKGGVRSATGDYNGDGVEDIIVTAAQGGNGHVVVYDGVTFNVLASFFSFPGFQGSVNISAGDLEGDGFAEIVVGVASFGPSHVKAFGSNLTTPVASFIAYPGYFGGVTVAAGDVNGDGKADFITGTMGGTTPHVVVFDGTNPSVVLYSFYAFDPLYAGAVNVAAADLDGDSKAEIITGSGPGSASTIVVFKVNASNRVEVLRSFFPFGGLYLGGVSVGSGDWNNDGQVDVVAGAQSGPMPTVEVYNGSTWALIDQLFAFNGTLPGGVSIG